MSEITEHRRKLKAAVAPLLCDGETVSVSAAPSEYEAGLNKLRFSVTVAIDGTGEEATERLDELLEPKGGVLGALKDAGASVTRSSGHQALSADQLGATWTAQILT